MSTEVLREKLQHSDTGVLGAGRAANALYDDTAFERYVRALMAEALDAQESPIVDDLDAAALDYIAERMARESLSALFMIRNSAVTAEQAGIEEGDRIDMVAADDPEKTIRHVVVKCEPDNAMLIVVREADDGYRHTHLEAGHVHCEDRFTVNPDDDGGEEE